MTLEVNQTQTRYDTTYIITGSKKDVQQKVQQLKKEFHPAGYGTRVSQENGTELNYTAIVIRDNNCD